MQEEKKRVRIESSDEKFQIQEANVSVDQEDENQGIGYELVIGPK